jgi:hypothetical protein
MEAMACLTHANPLSRSSHILLRVPFRRHAAKQEGNSK